jgi:transposase
VSHRNAPLTPAGRLRLVHRCQHRPIAHVAAEAGISRQCLSRWVNRYRTSGDAGLHDRASVSHHQPTTLDPVLVAEIEKLRRDRKWSARRIASELQVQGHTVSVATVGRWFVRLGINRRRFLDPTGAVNRGPANTILARYPGHMVHVDIKKVGRIPDGGGWRIHGKNSDHARTVERRKTKGVRAGYRSATEHCRRATFCTHRLEVSTRSRHSQTL